MANCLGIQENNELFPSDQSHLNLSNENVTTGIPESRNELYSDSIVTLSPVPLSTVATDSEFSSEVPIFIQHDPKLADYIPGQSETHNHIYMVVPKFQKRLLGKM